MSDRLNDPVVATPPTDDAGSLTQDRFDYQAHLAAARCARMLVDDKIVSVICEWHEDYVVQYQSGPSELVSVKHLEPGQARWTISALCDAGGVRHLFERWRRVKERCICRLQTNCGLRPGLGEAGELREACGKGAGPELRRWAERLAPLLGSTDLDEVERFLSCLRFECELPDRHTVAAVMTNNVMRPVLREMHVDEREADRWWGIVHGVVATASCEGDRLDVSVALSDPSALTGDAKHRLALERKTINRTRLLESLDLDRERPRILLAAATPPRERTRLVKKLERGGLGPTAIRSAVRLRSNWLLHEHRWSVDLPGGQAELEHLRSEVLHRASGVETRTRRPNHSYGPAMQKQLERILTVEGLNFDPALPVSDLLLLGLLYDRTEACEVWWSDEFDPDTVP